MRNLTIRKICDRLRDYITFGKFKPGERLSEKLLTLEYNVSRASIREMIGQLASHGYLTVEPNGGAVVTKLSRDDVDITHRIITRCESLTGPLAARHAKNGFIEKFDSRHEEMQNYPNDQKRWLQLNQVFHQVTYTNSCTTIPTNIIHHISPGMHRYRTINTNYGMFTIYNGHNDKILVGILDEGLCYGVRHTMDHLGLTIKQ